MRALVLIIALALAGCAWTPSRSCTVGLTFFGPVPIPMAGCEVTFSPEEDEQKPVAKPKRVKKPPAKPTAPVPEDEEEDEDV